MYSPSIQNLVEKFSKFPTVGPRTAARFVFFLLRQDNKTVKELLELKPPTTVGIYAKLGQVELRIMTKAKNEKLARIAIAKIEKKIRAKLVSSCVCWCFTTRSSHIG